MSQLPTPAAVARRPRDERGIPVPAITPWRDGVPQFRQASGERQLLCALQNLCSVCGGAFAGQGGDGGVWHVVDHEATKWIDYALRRGAEPAGMFSTYEVPGHFACMLYAAIACPYLASPTARRTTDNTADPHRGHTVAPGSRRGALAGLAEFTTAAVRTGPEIATGYDIVLAGPRTILPYRTGDDLLPRLEPAIAAEPSPPPAARWLDMDERAVARELRRALKHNA